MNSYKNIQKIKNKYNPYNGLSRELVLKIHNFVLRLRNRKSLGQRTIAKEIKKRFGIDISENTVSGWIHRHIIPYAHEKTQFKSKPIPPRSKLHNLYVKKNLSASKIAKKFNVSTIIIINWLRHHKIKTRTHLESMNTPNIKGELGNLKLKKPSKNYKHLTPEKAYILGVLCGDGYIDKKTVKLEIRKDKEFIKEFSDCIVKVYGLKYDYKYKVKRNTFICGFSCMTISKDLLRYGNFKTFSWKVPYEILDSSNKKIIISFLRGLYDSDGTVSKYYVNLTSSSYKGLKGVSRLLSKLKIGSHIKKDKYNTIYVHNKKNLRLFKESVGFTIKRKMERLNKVYKLGWRNDKVY